MKLSNEKQKRQIVYNNIHNPANLEFINARFFRGIYVVMTVHALEYVKVYGSTC